MILQMNLRYKNSPEASPYHQIIYNRLQLFIFQILFFFSEMCSVLGFCCIWTPFSSNVLSNACGCLQAIHLEIIYSTFLIFCRSISKSVALIPSQGKKNMQNIQNVARGLNNNELLFRRIVSTEITIHKMTTLLRNELK